MLSNEEYEKSFQVSQLKSQLQKYKYDIEQVELFGMRRDDYKEKKEICKNIILELRQLETQLKDVNIIKDN